MVFKVYEDLENLTKTDMAILICYIHNRIRGEHNSNPKYSKYKYACFVKWGTICKDLGITNQKSRSKNKSSDEGLLEAKLSILLKNGYINFYDSELEVITFNPKEWQRLSQMNHAKDSYYMYDTELGKFINSRASVVHGALLAEGRKQSYDGEKIDDENKYLGHIIDVKMTERSISRLTMLSSTTVENAKKDLVDNLILTSSGNNRDRIYHVRKYYPEIEEAFIELYNGCIDSGYVFTREDIESLIDELKKGA